jgi:tetratricopeptide (TPR) repeat protein
VAYSKIGDHEMAIRDLTNVIQKNSDHVNALFARAACYNTIGQFSAAIEDYNIALLKDQSQNLLRAASPEKARRSSFSGSVSSRMDLDGSPSYSLLVSHSL